MLSSVDFAAARRAEQDDELALEQVEVHAAQGVHLDLAHVVDLGQPTGLQNRVVVAAHRASRVRG